jgi:putative membrane protein
MWKFAATACAALFAAGSAFAQDGVGQAFVSEATSVGLTAIALGRMADAKSSNVRIQTLGRDIARDHEAANEELSRLAGEKDLVLPDTVPADKDQRGNSFDSLLGDEFDRRFLEATIRDHAAAITLFDREAASGADAELRDFARRMLPALRGHLAAAQALQSP